MAEQRALDADALAQACSAQMHANDRCARAHGIELLESRPGYARLSMRVRPDMLNGHAMCHGGMIFTLADTAFAHACNNANRVTVANGGAIDFLAPAQAGDTLIACAAERARGGRTGVYDVAVTNAADDALVALFRGRSYQTRGTIIEGD